MTSQRPPRSTPPLHPPYRLARAFRGAGARISSRLFLLILLALLSAGAGAPAVRRVAEPVRSALRADGKAVVFVNLAIAAPASASPADRAASERTARGVEASLLDAPGTSVRYRFEWIPSIVVEVQDARALEILDRLESVDSVHLDQRGRGALLESAVFLRAPEARALGFSGEGSVAAVLDSGVNAEHPALAGAIIHQKRFLQQGRDTGDTAVDGHGHGTNVTGIIASRGIGAPMGIAPGVKIIAVKVLEDDNTGWLSDWTAGLNHVIGLKMAGEISADVINMSLVSNSVFSERCDLSVPAFSIACELAQAQGMVMFAASGNDSLTGDLPIPACYSPVISVGSLLDSAPSRLSSFTNRNQFLSLLAPGQPITSTGLGEGTNTFAGTSQATPHAAAVACLLREIDSSLGPQAIQSLLVRSGHPFTDVETDLVFPVLDARAAVEAALVPPIESLQCASVGSSIIASWAAGSREESTVLRIASGDDTLLEETLAGSRSSFEWTAPAPGEYTLCAYAEDAAGLRGLEECCAVDIGIDRPFRRGDCGGDGGFDISDPIRHLGSLFGGLGYPTCAAACDSNDDERLDLSDAVYSLHYLFASGTEPPPPFPDCGEDLTTGELVCDEPDCQ
ncbi:MAG TPA: S8 family serine peptidase [Planctomycetota bacterium]|nr:S8 family serine peptidase [Planctomycetota bacterium]